MEWFNTKCPNPECSFAHRVQASDQAEASRIAQEKHDSECKDCYESGPFTEVVATPDDDPID